MRAIDANLWVCGDCHQITRVQANAVDPTCRRCGTRLYARKPNSIARTWALLITATVLYVPANLLDIMTINLFGSPAPSTIMGGVVELVHADMIPIALVVFVASIVVPTFKLIGIALLLYSVQRHQRLSPKQRILMYRFIEWIGRWSMLDIFVIAILVALVNFGNVTTIEAGPAAAAFCAVVIMTMLAALTFDPRLIWDNTQTEEDHG